LPRLLLFDIDNTLLYSGGAGSVSMAMAFHDMFGVEDGFKGVEFSGRTDRYILAEAMRQHSVGAAYEDVEDSFLTRYFGYLPDKLHERDGSLMPGFPELLEALAARPGTRLGLATGNFSGSARIKLEHFGIYRYFEGGGFGEESEDRDVVVGNAIQRLADGLAPADVLVIGDTPHDITAAKANGATAVGVATGHNPADDLRGAGADVVFEDFSDWREAARRLSGS
jgi:phosphoglycolate phosphatase